jgi:hypothetical protein
MGDNPDAEGERCVMHDVEMLMTRRTHVVRHRPERLVQLLSDYAGRGVLVTRPADIARQRNTDGTWTVRFEIWEPAPASRVRMRRLWESRPLRRAFLAVGVLCALFLAGELLWLLVGRTVAAASGPIGKVFALGAAVAVILLPRLRRSGCPGVTTHCPPHHHR